MASKIVILGTGGTIAGTSATAGDNLGYTAAKLTAGQLIASVPLLAGRAIEVEQVAQLDSKDMDAVTWQRLAECAARHLVRADVAGLVVTHGTDTLEETAYFLHRVLAPAKPIVLTGAMRPATSLQADGPQNLADAVTVASHPDASGVVVVMAGAIHAAEEVQKRHGYRIDAFASGDAGPIGLVEEGQLRVFRPWPRGDAIGLAAIAAAAEAWPRVELVTSHAGADGRTVELLVAAGVDGIVAAGTGNGTLHARLEDALQAAAARGVAVRRCTRVGDGTIVGDAAGKLPAFRLSPAKARIELLLALLAGQA
jgi:L-asparaginase